MLNDDNLDGLLSVPTLEPEVSGPTPPDLDYLKRMFREAYASQQEQQIKAFLDRDMYDGHQITPHQRAVLRKRKQPETFYNRIRKAIDGTLGLIDSAENSPEAIARNEDGEEAATIVTEMLRYQAEKEGRLDKTFRTGSMNFVLEGIGAAIIEVDDDDDARPSAIPFEEFYFDPYSKEHDFSDARYLIRAKWLDADMVKRRWPQANGITGLAIGSFDGEGPEDNPSYAGYWVDPERRRVMVVENYYRDAQTNVWHKAIYCHCILLEWGVSGYKDDMGRPMCAIEAVAYAIDRNLHRYGMARDMVPIQHSINGRASSLLRMSVSNRTRVSDAAVYNAAERDLARAEAQKPDGHLPPGVDLIQGDARYQEQLALLNADIAALDEMAPSKVLLGQASGANESGRARQMLQQSGLSALARAFAHYQSWQERIYRQMWFRTLQFSTEKRMIRVTNSAGARQSLNINVPVVGPVHQPVLDPQTGQPAINPHTGQPLMQIVQGQVGVHNEVAKMDMDITMKSVQSADTLRSEAKQKLMEYSARLGISLLDPSMEFAIQFLDIPDKLEILNLWKRIAGEAQQQQAQAQQAQQAQAQQNQQIQQAQVQSKIEREQAAAKRDATLADVHQMDVAKAGLDLAYRQQMMARGLDPDNPHGLQ